MSSRKRNSNFELLRVICMILIIVGHAIMYHGSLGELGTTNYYIGNIIRSFCMMAVNCFVLISGYFGINFSIKKIIKIDITVVFYSIVIFLLSVILGIHSITPKTDILLLFPILTKRYWFISIYIVLCLISPILNIIVNSLEKKQYKNLLIILLVLFYILPTALYAINAPTITGDSGYGIINFICLYLIGRYISLYYRDSKPKTFYLTGYIIVSCLLFLSNHILSEIFGFYFNTFISYDTIFALLSAIMLFMFFKNISINSKLINKLASGCFASYIIHMHPTISRYIFKDIFNIQKYTEITYLLSLLIIPILVFIITSIVEYIRVLIWGGVEEKICNLVCDTILVKKIEKGIESLKLSETISN